jgi:hypothetical protein
MVAVNQIGTEHDDGDGARDGPMCVTVRPEPASQHAVVVPISAVSGHIVPHVCCNKQKRFPKVRRSGRVREPSHILNYLDALPDAGFAENGSAGGLSLLVCRLGLAAGIS